VPSPVRLADLTTLRLGGPAPELITATTGAEIAEVLRDADAGAGALVLGGGSNLVVADAGIDVPVVRVAVPGVRVRPTTSDAADSSDREHRADGSAIVTVGAGMNWDDVVAELTDAGYADLGPLSGIPGSAGATPVQNVGAYGTEISDVLIAVTVYDRVERTIRTMPASDLGLGYRTSVLRGTDRAVVVDLTLRLRRGDTRIRYAELARALGVAIDGFAPPGQVRDAVLALRRGKGMVLDPADPDTTSAGSFFTNPILGPAAAARAAEAIRARLGAGTAYPAYPAAGGATKLSAAWLIERAGFAKGHQGPGGRVAISGKHTLALTNRGGGSTADLVALAREIRDGVDAAFGVRLRPEPVFVGVSL
jgi:UDP-N-acetylmuramate dehydrogenase